MLEKYMLQREQQMVQERRVREGYESDAKD